MHHGLRKNWKLHWFWIVHFPICIYQGNLDTPAKPNWTKAVKFRLDTTKAAFFILVRVQRGLVQRGGGNALLHIFQQTHYQPQPTSSIPVSDCQVGQVWTVLAVSISPQHASWLASLFFLWRALNSQGWCWRSALNPGTWELRTAVGLISLRAALGLWKDDRCSHLPTFGQKNLRGICRPLRRSPELCSLSLLQWPEYLTLLIASFTHYLCLLILLLGSLSQ